MTAQPAMSRLKLPGGAGCESGNKQRYMVKGDRFRVD